MGTCINLISWMILFMRKLSFLEVKYSKEKRDGTYINLVSWMILFMRKLSFLEVKYSKEKRDGTYINLVSWMILSYFVILSQMLFGRLQSGLRQKCIKITDTRVQKMNEVLTYVKLIKMYAWELPFSKTISGQWGGLEQEKGNIS